MQRRDFIRILGSAAVAWPLGAYAQQPKKIWRIGMLETIAAPLKTADYDAFLAGMESLGYAEARDFKIEYRSADGHPDRFPKLAQDLVSQNVDLITTRGTPAAFAAKNATKTIPVVMMAIGEPLLIVASLARPGGNVTGLSAFVNDLMGKRTEILRDMLPGLSWVGAILNMSNRSQPPQWTEIQKTARANGIETQLFDVRSTADLVTAIDDASKHKAGAVVVGIDTLTQSNQRLIIELAAKQRVPAIYPSREFVDAGGLISFGANYPDLYRRAATFVDKIFKGAKPSDLPVEQPTKFEMIVNLKSAKAIGLTVPPMLLARADEVIE
jgi:putative tryptophan/tyrosine transport system substrate-binding protein